MQGSMHPVLHQVGGEHQLEDLEPDGLRSHEARNFIHTERLGEGHRRPERQEREQLDAHVIDEEISDVRRPASAEDSLPGTQGERPLERHEHDREHEQVQQEPVEPEMDPAVELAAYFDVGATQGNGRKRERKSRKSECLAPAQHEVEASAQECDTDDELDQGPHDRYGVARPEVGRSQQVREMQDNDGAEGGCAEEDAENATDPAGSHVLRLCIAEPAAEPAFNCG